MAQPSDDAARSRHTNICLSGGGIRSASFSLGALQALQAETGLVYGERHAQRLMCVSGGSYIASTLVLPHSVEALSPAKDVGGEQPVFPLEHSGPVEQFLRRNCRYLFEQPGRIWGVIGSFVLCLVVNLFLIAVPIFVVGYVLGRGYYFLHQQLTD